MTSGILCTWTHPKRQTHREVGTQSQGPHAGSPAAEGEHPLELPKKTKDYNHVSTYSCSSLLLSFRMQLFR